MKTFAIVFVFIALASAKPAQVSLTQDTNGNYKLFYETADSSRVEEGFAGGKVIGTYNFRDKEHPVHTIKYLSSAAGFTAEGIDIPTAVKETEAVSAVRLEHLAKQEKERTVLPVLEKEEQGLFSSIPNYSGFGGSTGSLVSSQGFFIENNDEIEAAKAAHFAAHKEALERLNAAYNYIGICKKCICKKNCH